MKKLFQVFSITLLTMAMSVGSCLAQTNHTVLNMDRKIDLNGDSTTEEIKIEVQKGTSGLEMAISSVIRSGSLTIEIYNPNGEKKGNFSVGGQLKPSTIDRNKKDGGGKSEVANGRITKYIENPQLGNWVIKIIPERAEGGVSITSRQSYDD